jgi:hypothetical protein
MKSTTYGCDGKPVICSLDDLRAELSRTGASTYVYLLCYPPLAQSVVPFYVGIGRGDRLFAHEKQARDSSASGNKIETIRKIWKKGGEVLRIVDSFHENDPWHREQELISQFGLVKNGTGILTNEQRYSESSILDGVELRKYVADGNELPGNFIRRDTRLMLGPRRPTNPNSVYGKIVSVLERYPGITGADLVEHLMQVNFSDIASAYTQSGLVSRPWLAKYIDGGFYEKNRYICVYEPS